MRLVGGMVGAAIGMIVIDGYDDGLLQMSVPVSTPPKTPIIYLRTTIEPVISHPKTIFS